LAGISVTSGYDSLLRRTSVTVTGASQPVSIGYTYDGASRLQTVSDGANPVNTASYSYLANSSLVGQNFPVR
jgi:hypothetical protein